MAKQKSPSQSDDFIDRDVGKASETAGDVGAQYCAPGNPDKYESPECPPPYEEKFRYALVLLTGGPGGRLAEVRAPLEYPDFDATLAAMANELAGKKHAVLPKGFEIMKVH